MIVVSAHKLGGPPGIGALLVRDLGLLEAAGGQEQGYRGGTENLPGALGFAAAVEACQAALDAGLERVARLGFARILVFPYFLFTGILVKRIYEETDAVAAAFPEIEFIKVPYLRDHPLVQVADLTPRIHNLDVAVGEPRSVCHQAFVLADGEQLARAIWRAVHKRPAPIALEA